MILTNILYRTFFIKAAQYGTAFTIEVEDAEYLVTARHLLNLNDSEPVIRIFRENKWLEVKAKLIGHGRGEIDISVLKLTNRLTDVEFVVTPSMGEIELGQDVYFLGFPYKMWGDVGSFMSGLPLPFAKKGTLSSVSVTKPQMMYVDAINNEGFSGGPLFFYPIGNPNELRIAGVVSKFRVEYESVLDEEGELTLMTVPYNTGFLVAYGISHVLEIIRARSNI
ncbi:serine protease [Pseudomonas fluorescens]|uniref:S1 family peptidase n=1 Tax=Pseudomonas fluorescens TaxID=294 RepID=UPI0021D10144|nr:serine protease [Pseudomonas fluorescens]UXV17252.1 serine protease [Pseudomonas fluorescens]